MHQRNLIGQNSYGEFVNIQTDAEGNLKTDASKAGLGEGLVSQLSPVLQETFHYWVNPRIWDSFDDAGTVLSSSSMDTITTFAVPDAAAGISSIKRVKCKAGIGVLCRFTALWTTDNNQPFLSYIGIGDPNMQNGFYFSMTETGMSILHANDNIPTIIPQKDWDDPCDGYGGMPFLEWNKGNAFQIQLQYLGYDAIKFYVENPDSCEFQLVHTIKYGNRYGTPSLATTTVPFAATIRNTGNGDAAQTMQTASVGLFVEGKNKIRGIKNTFTVSAVANATENAVFTIANNPLFKDAPNTGIMYPTYLAVSNEDTKTAVVKLVENTTLGGEVNFEDFKEDESIASYELAGTTVTGGEVILTLLVAPNSSERINLKEYDIEINPREKLTISSYTGNSTASLFYSIGWVEDV